MEGAFEAMGEGTVDVNWAKEHHRLWLEAGNGAHRPERNAASADGDAGRIVGRTGRTIMKSFVLAVVAAVVIASVAGFALNEVQKPADQAFSTTGVRL